MDIELIREIFHDAGVKADDEDMQYIFDQFEIDAQNSSDLYSDSSLYSSTCTKCERLEYELSEAKHELNCYRESVKQRRGASSVWVDRHGKVKYTI